MEKAIIEKLNKAGFTKIVNLDTGVSYWAVFFFAEKDQISVIIPDYIDPFYFMPKGHVYAGIKKSLIDEDGNIYIDTETGKTVFLFDEKQDKQLDTYKEYLKKHKTTIKDERNQYLAEIGV